MYQPAKFCTGILITSINIYNMCPVIKFPFGFPDYFVYMVNITYTVGRFVKSSCSLREDVSIILIWYLVLSGDAPELLRCISISNSSFFSDACTSKITERPNGFLIFSKVLAINLYYFFHCLLSWCSYGISFSYTCFHAYCIIYIFFKYRAYIFIFI